MSDRAEAKARFLNETPWASWQGTAIAQDASARSYTRLSDGRQSVILMNAPPSAGEDVRPFIHIGNLLQGMNLAPPQILAADADQGFLILQDLGPIDVASAISVDPKTAEGLYKAAADVLTHIAKQPAPDLPKMDPTTAGNMVRITAEHYARAPTIADDLADHVTHMMQSHCGPADTLALRDFHAENLIWRPKETGLHRVGLLDFQDAFVAPAGYDLASLLRDARRDIDRELADTIISYVAEQTVPGRDQLNLQLRCLAIQRNLRILGVFARLISVHGKTRYRAMLPRVWRYITEDLDHPALTDLRKLVSDGLPDPSAWNPAI